jgi:hypothetical protein
MKKDGSLITWFLSFLNVDLEDQSYGDMLKLVVELEGALRGHSYREDPYGDMMVTTGMALAIDDPAIRSLLSNGCENVKRLQKALNEFVGGIKISYDKAKERADALLSGEECDSLRVLGRIEVTLEVKAKLGASFGARGSEDSISGYYFEKKALDEATCWVRTSSKDMEDAVKYQFLRSFNDLPLKALRKCPICDKWFLHLSKREREFCSNRCAAKNISRKKYAALKQDPLLYKQELEKKKEHNHAYYEREVHKVHPNASVPRRPRNPKAKED